MARNHWIVGGARKWIHAAYYWLIGTYQRRALNLLLLVFALDYADRTLIGALGPTIEDAFDIGNFQLGLLSTTFLIVGAAAAIPMGMLTDRVNRTVLLAASFALWALAVGLVGASSTFAMFFGFRIVLGIVAATSGPAIPSLTGDLVSAARRGWALGTVNSGSLIGLFIGFALAAATTSLASWRWSFWLLSIAGLCLAFTLWCAREPERTDMSGVSEERGEGNEDEGGQVESRVQQVVRERQIEPSPKAMLEHDPSEMSIWEAAKYTVRVRTDLIALIARSVGDFFLQGVATFIIVFLTGWYGISQGFADIAILVAGIGALAGVLTEGRVSDAILRRGWLNGRIWVGALGYFFALAALYPAFIVHSLKVALPLFAVGAFFLAGARPPLDAIRVDVIVPTLRGRAESVRQVLRSAAEGGAPFIIGLLSTELGGGAQGLQLAFLVTLPALLLNGLIMLIALRTYQPDVAAAMASSEGLRSSKQDQEPSDRDADSP